MEESWKGYSWWCPLSSHEAHCAERLLAQNWLPRFSIQLFISSLACFWWEDTLHHNTMIRHGVAPAWLEYRAEKLRPAVERYLGNSECAGGQLILLLEANFIIDFYSTNQFLLNMLILKNFFKNWMLIFYDTQRLWSIEKFWYTFMTEAVKLLTSR